MKTTRMIAGLSVALIGMASFSPAQPSAAPKRTLIVLDASGSMWGQIQGRAKIEIAREVIAELIEGLPDDTELGLVAYGHRRKGDCADIELLVPLGKLDRAGFVKTVNAIMPKGMTPLTAAVEFAAVTLSHTEQAATVILVTDGEETCDRDPCEAARTLKELGVDFKAHVIAFDLAGDAAKSVECMARETGGLFLTADDASSLSDALQMTLEPEAAMEEPVPEEPGEADLKAPAEVTAGAPFKVEWTGPDEKTDYITIVRKGAKEETYGNYTYTRNGSPLDVTALIETGPAELRYIHGRTSKTLGRLAIEVKPAEVTLQAATEAVAGQAVGVKWTGPDNSGDYITIVPKISEDGTYANYTSTTSGSPMKVAAPMEPGDCEIRYHSGQGAKVLARIPLEVTPADVTLKAPQEAVAGAAVPVEWTGPDNDGDYITIVPGISEDGQYALYTPTSSGNPMKVVAPIDPGDCEIRYHSGQGAKVLARIPLKVTPADCTLKAPQEAVAGAAVPVEWTGPDNNGDYITIVPKISEDGQYALYTPTSSGNPMKVVAPIDPGDCEIRYHAGQGAKVLARIPLKVIPADVTLKAPSEAGAGAAVSIQWTGPDNNGDYITIVPKDFEDGRYADYAPTSNGTPMKVNAPADAGDCEIRYHTGQGGKVLARIALKVTPSTDEQE